jgi:NAD(P)-dependent dehydrogenase (short-subunit alcohol dehydrogenase family)
MSDRLIGKVCVITGGASGIGKASALRFLHEGAFVVVGDLNAANREQFLLEAAQLGHGDRVRASSVNVALEADVAALVDQAVECFGRLDVMFNNAGIGGAFGSVTDVTVEDWDETFAVLVRGVFLGVKHATKAMLRNDVGANVTRGSIINTASVAGISGGGGPVAYSAAKAAVINMTKTLSLELGSERVRVNAIAPGAIQTPLLQQGRRVDVTEVAGTLQPWPDGGRPEDIAATALFLASDESQFVTGETIIVDGGLTASGASAWGIHLPVPTGYVGMNRGTTGQGPTVHQRPPGR